jgi:TolB-like protein
LFFACFESIGYAQQKGKVRLAVLDFTLTGQAAKDSPDLHTIVQEWLISFLVETRAFEVVERQELEKVLQEQSLGQTGILNEETAAQAGEILGVNVLITGKLISFEDTLEVNVRMIDAANGSILGVANVSTEDEDELRAKVKDLAEIIQRKLSVPRSLGEIKIHETFDGDKLDQKRWFIEFSDEFNSADKKKTNVTIENGVLRVTGKFRKNAEYRNLWLAPNSAQPYYSFEAKVRVREIKGDIAICVGALWDEEESWAGICPYWEEEYTDIDVGIEEKDREDDTSTVDLELQTNIWYTMRVDYINGQFHYYWDGELLKQDPPSRLPEVLEWNLDFYMDDTKSVIAEIDEISLR